jgi:hypothetical protein
LLFECLHQRLERAACRQPVAIVTDGVLIGHRAAKVETEETHPAQAISDYELHARIRKVMLRLNHQHFEHRHGIERRPAALGSVAITKAPGQNGAKALELYRRGQDLKWITALAQPLRQRKQAAWVHQTSPSNAPSESQEQLQSERFLRVSI